MHRNTFTKFLLFMVAAQLAFVCTASAQPYAYVSNLSGNNISIVNTANNSVVGSVIVATAPTGLAVTPDGSAVYIASQAANVVTVLNTSSNTIGACINVGRTPTQVAVNPNGAQVYAINQGENTVSIIDTGSKAVVATIPVGSRPNGIAFDPSGARAYVANLWSGSVSIIDTASRSVTKTFPADSGPSAIAVTPDGRSVYVTNQYSGIVTVHDASGNLLKTIQGFTYPNSLAITPNGARILVTNGNAASVSVVDTASNSIVANPSVQSIPTSVAISPDGARAYVTNEYGFSVSVIDTASSSVMATIKPIGVYPIAVAMMPAPVSGPTPPVCTYSISPGSVSYGSTGGSGTLSVNAPSGCSWSAATDSTWINFAGSSSGSGSGTVGYVISGNAGTAARSGNISIAGHSLSITQSGLGFTPIRVNCGGPAFTDASGNAWSDDQQRNRSITMAPIANTPNPAIYQKESWSTGTLQYQFTVPNGSFTVKLHFSEFYLCQSGQRVFDIVINGQVVHPRFDILSQTGPNAANVQTFSVSVTSGQLTIQLVPVTGSPKLAGIEIL